MAAMFRSFLLFTLLILAGCAQRTIIHQTITPAQMAARENAHLVFNYLHTGYTDKAQEKLQIALQQAPQDPVILDTAGYYYEKTGQIKIANQFYKQAVKAAPFSGIAKNNYGAFLCRNGYYGPSLPLFQQAARTPNTSITAEAIRNEQYCHLKMDATLGDRRTYAYHTRFRME